MIYNRLLTFRQNVSKAASGDFILEGDGQNIWIQEAGIHELPEGLQLMNMTLKCQYLVEMYLHSHVGIYNVDYYAQNYSSPAAIMEIVAADGVVIDGLRLYGDTDRRGILCRSYMTNTKLHNIRIVGNIGWGILINDAQEEQRKLGFANYRTVIGTDYSSYHIGENIDVVNFESSPIVTRAGDPFQINTPESGLQNITVDGFRVHKTVKSAAASNDGMAFGAANVKNLSVKNVQIDHAARFGLHVEKGGNHLFEDFKVRNTARALSASHTSGTVFRKGECTNNEELFTSYNTLATHIPGTNVTIDNVTFDGFTRQGVWASNCEGYKFRNLTLKGHNAPDKTPFIRLYKAVDTLGGANGVELDNIKMYDTGTTKPEQLIVTEHAEGVDVISYHSPDFAKKIKVNGNIIHG